MVKNYSLQKFENITEFPKGGSHHISNNVRVAIDPGKGLVDVVASEKLELNFYLGSQHPSWMELVFTPSGDEWKNCHTIFLTYKAESRGILIRPALRFGYEEGHFKDLFSKNTHKINSQLTEFGAEFNVPPRISAKAMWMDLHLFFTPADSNCILHELHVTGFN